MRSSRLIKKRNHKKYIRLLLWWFLVIIPVAALSTSVVLHVVLNEDETVNAHTAAVVPADEVMQAFKYSQDVKPKVLYRVEIQKYEKYEDAEATIASLQKKRLNGFIVKENGYVTCFGVFADETQAKSAAEFLTRKKVTAVVNIIEINGASLQYNEKDKRLIELSIATDGCLEKIIKDKSAFSLESLYGNKKISETDLNEIIENEQKLYKYLNYLMDEEPSQDSVELKADLERLIREALGDTLKGDETYDYYTMQNSLMNQAEALRRFYSKNMI